MVSLYHLKFNVRKKLLKLALLKAKHSVNNLKA